MLYIASALTPTPIIDTVHIPAFTSTAASSLIVAKTDRIEVWDVGKTGLVKRAELQVWGTVVSIATVDHDTSSPYLLILLSPPNAQLLLATYDSPSNALIVTSSISLIPPTPSLRQAEFFSSVISQKNVALVSLWTGVLTCADIEVEKDKDVKKRRASVAGSGESGRLHFRDHFNINVREHNLLSMAFNPSTLYQAEPTVSFLWQSSSKALLLQNRKVSLSAHSLLDASSPINVVTPLRDVEIANEDDFDFNDIPYSCPAARHVLPVNHDQVIVIGDEHVVLYKLNQIPTSPRVSRASFSSVSGTATSPRASAVRRSPQNELSAPGKRRKSSNTGGKLGSESEKWEFKPVWRARQGFGTVLASSVLESHGAGGSVIIADESGRLIAFGWEMEGSGGMGQQGNVRLSKMDLGIASAPSSLTYLDASHLFLASACGDSLLIKLQIPTESTPSQSPTLSPSRAIPARKGKSRSRDNEEGVEWALTSHDGKGGYEVKERWINLAPLKDFCVVEDEAGAMSHLVAASGASSSNSLRTIRSGVGLEDILSIAGFDNVTGLYPFADAEGNGKMLVSTSTSTYMVTLDPEAAIAQVDRKIASHPTLAAGLCSPHLLLHVNARSVSTCAVSDLTTLATGWEVSDDSEIVCACISENFVVVAKKGGEMTVLKASANGVEPVCTVQINSEAAAVTIISHKTLAAPTIAVSTWTGEILLYTLNHLMTAEPPVTTLWESFYACSLFIRSSSSSTTTSATQLVAGLSDGTMVVYDLEISSEGGGVKSTSRKSSGLGSRPLKLFPTQEFVQGDETIIAVGLSERMSLIFESKGRIDFSSVNKKDVTAAAGASLSGQSCLVYATPAGVTFTDITSLKKLSIQTLDMDNRSPMKIVSLPSHKLLGVGSVSRKMDAETGDIMQSSYFELRDPVSLQLLIEMPLDAREQVTSLTAVFLNGRHYVAVGTSLFSEDENDEYSHGVEMLYAREGRLRLVEPTKDRTWQIVVKTTLETVGAVHDVTVIHGFLAVAAGSRVSILKFDSSQSSLHEVSHFASAFIAQHLYVSPPTKLHAEDRLVVGDGMRSIFVLEVDEGSGVVYADQRDLATHQVMALHGVRDGGQSVLISDGHTNISTLRLNESIEPAASFGLHEPIAQLRKGSLIPQSSAPDVMKPELLYGTVDGRIGIIGELTSAATKTLVDLQRNMDKYYKGPGGTDWRTWRRGGTELIKKETAGFIDGDFVQRFLDIDLLSAEEQKKVFEGTTTHERVSKLVAGGKSVEADRSDVAGILEAAAGFH